MLCPQLRSVETAFVRSGAFPLQRGTMDIGSVGGGGGGASSWGGHLRPELLLRWHLLLGLTSWLRCNHIMKWCPKRPWKGAIRYVPLGVPPPCEAGRLCQPGLVANSSACHGRRRRWSWSFRPSSVYFTSESPTSGTEQQHPTDGRMQTEAKWSQKMCLMARARRPATAKGDSGDARVTRGDACPHRFLLRS